jgi:membrane protein YqaA with SNARE-associated domain
LLGWLFVALGIAIASSVLPILSVEVFLVAFAAHHPHLPVPLFILLGAMTAVGQVAGKLLYFYAARGSLHLPAFMHRAAGASQNTTALGPPPERGLRRWWHAVASRIRLAWLWLRVRCHRHPKVLIAATATSALFGVPPFLATTVLAGLAGLSLRTFVAASLPARFLRFTLLAASPSLVLHWWPVIHHHLHMH